VSGGGPIIKNKTFFFGSWEQFRLRTGSVLTTTVPETAFRQGDFSALLAQGIQLYDPYTVDASGNRKPYPNNQIPTAEFSKAATVMWDKYFVAPTVPGAITNNFTSATSSGGNTNQFVVRGDQNIGANTRLFGRFTYFGLLDLPTNPFGTGLCFDRCAENYHSKLLAIDLNHSFSSNMIFDLNVAGSRFVYGRQPILTGYDLTQLGWPASYNTPPDIMRTPPTPAFPFPNDVGKSQGNSAIGDHNTQYNITPALTIIHGKHSIQVGAQYELGLDNYFQTNIASGAFAFSGSWTAANALNAVGGFPFADFLLGLSQNQGSFVNQTEGVAQVPAQTAGKQTYRAFYGNDTWRVTPKFTLNLGLRYELQGGWSERYDRLSYWNPNVVNATVTGCGGTVGSPCNGDALLVGSGGNNIPLDKKEFSPRLGFAYSPDSKTVIRGGYGIFWIPNYVSFALNPDNDVINLATTPFTATTNAGLTPLSTLNSTGCSLPTTGSNTFADFTCTQLNQGPFGPGGILPPPGRTGDTSRFVAASGSPTLAPRQNPLPGYVQQYNFGIQRELPGQVFLEVAFAGSHGVHLPQYSTHLDQIPDSFIAQAAAQAAAKQPVTIAQSINNPMAGTSPNATIGAPMIVAGQLDRPYPQYTDINLAGYGCCGSVYNSLQMTATKRFQGGGTLLVAYTNAKLLTNTDTLTSWLENGTTGGVGQVQDWNNLDGERSLSSQDVSQRLVISYVLDLPFGKGQKFLNGVSGVGGKLVSGWGIDGVTTFQRGFPLKIAWGGAGTPLEALNVGVSNVRPNVSGGCNRNSQPSGLTARLNQWFNVSCFGAPPDWGFGTEPRVDPTLRADGINNFDFAVFKRTAITERAGLEFRTEFFNLFNHPQFGFPGTNFVSGSTNGFGQVTSQQNNPRLIQFALKFVF
jgi:TonB dependent receptor